VREREREMREATVQGFQYPWTRPTGQSLGPPDIVRVGWTLSGSASLSGRMEKDDFQGILMFGKKIALKLRIYINIGHGLQVIIT
jgi:hypothetical protein